MIYKAQWYWGKSFLATEVVYLIPQPPKPWWKLFGVKNNRVPRIKIGDCLVGVTDKKSDITYCKLMTDIFYEDT